MCDVIKVLSKVKSGELTVCSQCHIYHLEFNNIYLEFKEDELQRFKTFILDIQMDYWEDKYASSKIKRKIPIPSIQQNLVLMFNRGEITELKKLLFYDLNDVFESYLNISDIDYTLILN